MLHRLTLSLSLVVPGSIACQASVTPPAKRPLTAEECRANQAHLVNLLDSLPERGLAMRGRDDLPIASLGGVIGSGRVVDIDADRLLVDGEPVAGASVDERIENLHQRLAESSTTSAASPRLLYLAANRDLDVRTLRRYLAAIPRSYDLHLVFQAPVAKESVKSTEAASFADQLLSERDLATRHSLARNAYARHARCQAVLQAVDAAPAGDPNERWPGLREGLREAVPHCNCTELDSDELREIVMAEQRAGAAAVGSMPFDFMRDERCGASFGLNPLQKIVHDIEAFDEEFAGGYGRESLDFEQVVTNDRLLNYLCQALPGETLASLQRTKHTLYWKVQGLASCQPWQFEPLAPGSPLGTWRRQPLESEPALALYYWQGAEEIRLYGPITDPESKPTDEREWTCSQNFRMRGIDPVSIQLEAGRWFFDAESCSKAKAEEAAFPGCVAALAGGPPEVPETAPATFPAPGDGTNAP